MGILRNINFDSVRGILEAALHEECGDFATYASIRKAVGSTPKELGEYIGLLKRVGMLEVEGERIVTTEGGVKYLRVVG